MEMLLCWQSIAWAVGRGKGRRRSSGSPQRDADNRVTQIRELTESSLKKGAGLDWKSSGGSAAAKWGYPDGG